MTETVFQSNHSGRGGRLHRLRRARAAITRAERRPRRLEVTVGGRRVRTNDIHADVIIPEATALMGVKTEPDNASVIAPDLAHERFARMGERGTDIQALSINANWYGVDRDVAEKMIQL